jgi:hypothetical protein
MTFHGLVACPFLALNSIPLSRYVSLFTQLLSFNKYE